MNTQILVSVDPWETRVAILEDGKVSELYIERRGQRSVVGHVWKGSVGNVLAGMEAAFVDVGLEKSGFLHVDEVVAIGVPKHKRRITELLNRNDEVMVQATKDAMGTKGVRLTMQLSLAGRFLVYVPHGEGVGVSRSLPDEERKRLRASCEKLPLGGGGLIVRTAAAGAAAADLARDLESLRRLWVALQARAAKVKPRTLLYSEADISLKVIRDLLNAKVDEVLVDDEEQYERILGFLRRTSPNMAERVVRHEGANPSLLAKYGVERAILATTERRAPLPSGGYLVIDDTEALTVIDVNSGRYVGGKGASRLEDTATATNLEAAVEAARQLRLRDIGGIVVIDFIDMDKAKNRKAVMDALGEALDRDRTRTSLGTMSELGLVQLTRQKRSDGPMETMSEPCPTCEGAGWLLTDETLAIHVARRAAGEFNGDGDAGYEVRVNPLVAEQLGDESPIREGLAVAAGARVDVVADAGLSEDAFRVSPRVG